MLVNQGKVVRSQFERTLVSIGRTRGHVDEPILYRENTLRNVTLAPKIQKTRFVDYRFFPLGPGFSAEDLHCEVVKLHSGIK